ncbi:GNAT family N-acetyltransferase [Brachybacterium huguangmaarense]
MIRRASAADLPVLEAARMGEVWMHHLRERLAMQDQGRATMLLAWGDVRPCGNATVLRASKYEEVRTLHPDLAEINALAAYPTGRGTGTALIAAAEEDARAHGHPLIGLAVDADDNPDARRLYERLGYTLLEGVRVLDVWQEFRADGDGPWHRDPCAYLVKRL